MALNLKSFCFSGAANGPHLLITGGVHGDEFESIAAIRELVRRFDSDPALRAQLQGRLTLIPIVNEAAFLRGHRLAEDGRDLARSCPGRPDGSVTEQTAWALSERIRAADYYIDLHTGGTEFAVHPLAGYTLHADPTILDTQRLMARAFNLPVVWGTAPNLDGRSLSVARDAKVPAIYCEYLGSARCDSEGVTAYVEGCLNVMGELGMLRWPKPNTRIEYVIEDPSPGSGHMQIQNPSPATGFFEPSVALGMPIQSGEKIGTVYELGTFQPHDVISQQNGLVLVLRTFPRVTQGESVGVIAAIPSGFGSENGD
jgi:predicted deacylase